MRSMDILNKYLVTEEKQLGSISFRICIFHNQEMHFNLIFRAMKICPIPRTCLPMFKQICPGSLWYILTYLGTYLPTYLPTYRTTLVRTYRPTLLRTYIRRSHKSIHEYLQSCIASQFFCLKMLQSLNGPRATSVVAQIINQQKCKNCQSLCWPGHEDLEI